MQPPTLVFYIPAVSHSLNRSRKQMTLPGSPFEALGPFVFMGGNGMEGVQPMGIGEGVR